MPKSTSKPHLDTVVYLDTTISIDNIPNAVKKYGKEYVDGLQIESTRETNSGSVHWDGLFTKEEIRCLHVILTRYFGQEIDLHEPVKTFSLTSAQRNNLVDRMAGHCMMERRGNPDMGGPNALDRLRAEKLVDSIIWDITKILKAESEHEDNV